MKKRLFTWLKCFSMILVLSLLCVPLLTGAVAPAENVEVPVSAENESPVPAEKEVPAPTVEPEEEPAEEVAPVEVAPKPEPVLAVKLGTYDNVELIPGAYSVEVYELVGFSTDEAAKFQTSATKQTEEETFARLLYLRKMYDCNYTLEQIDITSEVALKEAAADYEQYLTLEDWQKKALQDNVQFYLDTFYMSQQEKLDLFYRQHGFDGVAGYKAWQEEQNRISPEENARRLKEDADKQRAKMEAAGIPHEHLTDAQLANP